MSEETTIKIKLPNVRLSFPTLFEMKSFKDGAPSFSATFLLDKDEHAKEIKKIQRAQKSVAVAKWGDNVPRRIKTPLKDGEEKDDLDGYDEDIMFIGARSYNPIVVVDQTLNTLTKEKPGPMHSGCYVNASIQIYAQDNEYGKRVNCSLLGVMYAGKGEAFGAAAPDADEEFGEYAQDMADQAYEQFDEDDEEPTPRKRKTSKNRRRRRDEDDEDDDDLLG